MSDSVRPHRWQPTRLPRPWDSPGKNSGVGCHFLLQWMKVKSESEVAQSCLTLSDPMDCSPPGYSVHVIFQARVLEWGAIAFSVIIGDWNAKVGSQKTPGVTGKFGLAIWNEARQRLIEFCQENALVIANTFQQHKRRLYTWTSLPGAGERHSTRDKGHEEGGSAYAKAGSSLGRPPDILKHLPPKTRVCLLYCFVLSPLTLLGAVPHHHRLALSVKELTYSSN